MGGCACRSVALRVINLLASVACASLDLHQVPGAPPPRSCDFYESHAYPATYNVELNVSCGVRIAAPGATGAVAAHGLGLFASRHFPQGETIAWIPESAHLWEPNIPWPIRHVVAENCEPKAYDESLLAVELLVERRDSNSRFKHYIAALAQVTLPEMQNIVLFAKDHISVLNVTQPGIAGSLQSSLRCMEAVLPKIEALREVPPSKGEQLWSLGIVKSRALRLRGRLALVPVADLANHGQQPSAEVSTREPDGGLQFQSLRSLAAGEEVTVAYGLRPNNLELLAQYGFVMPQNPSGMLLPFDFNALVDIEEHREGLDELEQLKRCGEALRSPRLWRDTPMLLEAVPARCLQDRLRRYYELHPSEMAVVSDGHVQTRALELMGQLCRQLLQRYRSVAAVVNRLQQHGQRARDWLTLQVAHEAVEDMRLLTTCTNAAKSREGEAEAAERDDL